MDNYIKACKIVDELFNTDGILFLSSDVNNIDAVDKISEILDFCDYTQDNLSDTLLTDECCMKKEHVKIMYNFIEFMINSIVSKNGIEIDVNQNANLITIVKEEFEKKIKRHPIIWKLLFMLGK